MESAVSETEIRGKEEGPKQFVEVDISAAEYTKHWYDRPDGYRWLFDQIEQKIPSSELRSAIVSADRERVSKIQSKVDVTSGTVLEESGKYAFRGVLRKSDGSPMWQHGESTLKKAQENIHRNGIEVNDENVSESAHNILPGTVWPLYVFPSPDADLDQDGLDTSIIMIYRNEDFILPPEQGSEKVKLVELTDPAKRNIETMIDKEEADEKGYPLLRDLYIGQIKINFKK